MTQFLTKLRHGLEDVLFPPLCLLCRAHLTSEERSLWLCSRCALPDDFPVGFFCPHCTRRSPSFPLCHPEARFGAIAPWSYGNKNIRTLVHMLKYKGMKAAAVPLGNSLARYVLASLTLGTITLSDAAIVPVPLYRARLRKRGFNQSLLLAHALHLPGVPVLEDALIKTRATPSQTAQENYEAREANILGSFSITRPEAVRGKTILLIDDVITSGSTMRESARVLKIAGAKRVIGIAAARA